jgi:hypothetical protein
MLKFINFTFISIATIIGPKSCFEMFIALTSSSLYQSSDTCGREHNSVVRNILICMGQFEIEISNLFTLRVKLYPIDK